MLIIATAGLFIYANSAGDSNFLAFVKVRKDTASISKVKEKIANFEDFEEQVDEMIIKGNKGEEIYTLEINRNKTKNKDKALTTTIEILEDKKVRSVFLEYMSEDNYNGFINEYLKNDIYKNMINGEFNKSNLNKVNPDKLLFCTPTGDGFCGYGWGNCDVCLRFSKDIELDNYSPEDIVDSQIEDLEGILDLVDEIMDLVGGGYKIVFKLSPKQGVNN